MDFACPRSRIVPVTTIEPGGARPDRPIGRPAWLRKPLQKSTGLRKRERGPAHGCQRSAAPDRVGRHVVGIPIRRKKERPVGSTARDSGAAPAATGEPLTIVSAPLLPIEPEAIRCAHGGTLRSPWLPAPPPPARARACSPRLPLAPQACPRPAASIGPSQGAESLKSLSACTCSSARVASTFAPSSALLYAAVMASRTRS